MRADHATSLLPNQILVWTNESTCNMSSVHYFILCLLVIRLNNVTVQGGCMISSHIVDKWLCSYRTKILVGRFLWDQLDIYSCHLTCSQFLQLKVLVKLTWSIDHIYQEDQFLKKTIWKIIGFVERWTLWERKLYSFLKKVQYFTRWKVAVLQKAIGGCVPHIILF